MHMNFDAPILIFNLQVRIFPRSLIIEFYFFGRKQKE